MTNPTTTSADLPNVEDYFAKPPQQRALDTAALIIALVQGREAATRTDYSHPKIEQIAKLLLAER